MTGYPIDLEILERMQIVVIVGGKTEERMRSVLLELQPQERKNEGG